MSSAQLWLGRGGRPSGTSGEGVRLIDDDAGVVVRVGPGVDGAPSDAEEVFGLS